jgi:transposase
LFNRKRGLTKLEAKVKAGKLDKNSINNRGYNKYLKLESEVKVSINYKMFEEDKKWDGLKGYLTNTDLKADQVLAAYGNLWQIEKAFKISKTDIKIRPVYHRIPKRIETHICICFVAYALFKEIERRLKIKQVPFSAYRAIDLTKNMYQIKVFFPDTKTYETIPLKRTEEQEILTGAIIDF